MSLSDFVRAYWTLDTPDCKKFGRYSCKNCLLVLHCGPECQKSHWPTHKTDCKSPVGKPTWTPDWASEKRSPACVGPAVVPFGGKKYLWGNVPAFDVLQLASNEGEDFVGPIRLLFAAQLSQSYRGSVEITLNDRDADVVARNVMMLLVAFVVDNVDEAIECIIHVWYSAFIRESDLAVLQQQIRPLIQDVCGEMKTTMAGDLVAKVWTFWKRSVRLVLPKSAWDRLLSFMQVPAGLTAEKAQKIRKAVTTAESRKDYRDRHLLFETPPHRIARTRFREDGLLLPFGHPRHEFKEPNPTFFQGTDTWPIHDNADPLHGWPSKDVEDTSSGPATADIYSKLLFNLKTSLRAFMDRMSGIQISFRHFQMEVSEDLPGCTDPSHPRQIKVSNISDCGYLGIRRTLAFAVPLLQEPSVNTHATLITLFMNAVSENMTAGDRAARMNSNSRTMKRMLKYLPVKALPTGEYDPMITSSPTLAILFAKELKFPEVAQFYGMAMKEKHTIIEKCPLRLKLRPGQPGAQDEFDRWKRL
ncbi:hypothetical protein N658DRAFT_566963 [Parathielavia hyrcaniae]|uniref:MYND-type domain-containing protein n=1 Tax=Parathielavia hyrcaniae TaxID=113614 RepID=A0AAN6Q0L7_9PEZI|nr:hypothetical protein N658DRAFT_566963 [Parathielavia hyrcaniae]